MNFSLPSTIIHVSIYIFYLDWFHTRWVWAQLSQYYVKAGMEMAYVHGPYASLWGQIMAMTWQWVCNHMYSAFFFFLTCEDGILRLDQQVLHLSSRFYPLLPIWCIESSILKWHYLLYYRQTEFYWHVSARVNTTHTILK